MYSKYFHLVLFCCFILLSSCGEETLKFTEPQPKGKKNLTEVKNKFIGKYQSISDSSILIIDEKEIRSQEYQDIIRYSKAEFDSIGKYEVKEDGLYELGRKLKYPLRWENDTAIVTHAYTESYFDFSELQVLRQDKGRLFLNYGSDDGLWKVEILSLKDDTLTWHMIPVNEEGLKKINEVIKTIEEIEEHHSITSDGESFSFNDTTIVAKDVKKRDFKTMINNNLIKEIGRYKKIENE